MCARLDLLEKKNRVMRWLLAGVVILAAYLAVRGVAPPSITVEKALLESREVKLLDAQGKPRFFLRMYSRVPVLQLIDTKGKPRMSLGLRFDDTPFIDLSDGKGRTRASFEMTREDEPMLRLMDERGDTTFKLKP